MLNFEELEFKKGNYCIFILPEVEKQIRDLRDANSRVKILRWLDILSERIPNNPEQWKKLKGESCQNVFELKPKPYRLGCLVVDRFILVVHMWRVQKDRSRRKSKEVEKACLKAEEVRDEFERFVRRVQVLRRVHL
ncbi:hypothetical protein [Phorcysia thermohydrogeniphila]|uniref:Phage derived Gp49-like protein DUF891 n=1 Tax=Phorcysia thermohydrogeniphila TaxID=936138 RepID=A0A4R1GEI4_9BACT|nr:hypothetical protein [Phorcysia thermohydrogeniphila]TCK05211.1 hypothetical protein CLV27_0637 [Phorcysia thermohydrogeniphila]